MLRRVALVSYFETPVLKRSNRRNNPEDTIIHSQRRENLKSYCPCMRKIFKMFPHSEVLYACLVFAIPATCPAHLLEMFSVLRFIPLLISRKFCFKTLNIHLQNQDGAVGIANPQQDQEFSSRQDKVDRRRDIF
jgi:hypothetical protein